jgi:hypothetical protein
MSRSSLLVALLLALCSVGCASGGLYDWGPYEDDLHQLYKSPESAAEFHKDLRLMIDRSRKKGAKIPPGIAAEYGFLEYQAGHTAIAIEYFDLERQTWPESATLMTRLIERIQAEPKESHDAPAEGTDPASAPSSAGDEGGAPR